MSRKQRVSPVAPIDTPRVDDERIVPLVPPVMKKTRVQSTPAPKATVNKPHRRTTPLVEDATSPRTIARRHIEEILAIWGVTLSKVQKRSAIDRLIRLADKPTSAEQLEAIRSHEAPSAPLGDRVTLPTPEMVFAIHPDHSVPVSVRLRALRAQLSNIIDVLG